VTGGRWLAVAVLSGAVVAAALLVGPVAMFVTGGLMAATSASCTSAGVGAAGQPGESKSARDSIPANYLALFRSTGALYHVPWILLAGIGKVESNFGRSNLRGVRSGTNAFGAAGPMQIGVGGAAGNQWGGAPVHPGSEKVDGVATDATGDGIASVYVPADAIAGAAKLLLEDGVLTDVDQAIFDYNHLESYVQAVLHWAGLYARGGYTVTPDGMPGCLPAVGQAPSDAAAAAIAYAEDQLGKPYQWGGTGPDAFDCSGLVMMAYRSAGIDIPRTSQQQWAWGPRIKPSEVQPGDLVFFAGSDGTTRSPGHVGLVIGGGLMIEAYATGYPIRVAPYGDRDPVGFTRPWAHKGAVAAGSR
jgi:peptidoglycan DL-endopeptidase CwlO